MYICILFVLALFVCMFVCYCWFYLLLQLETDRILATATVLAPKLLKMSFGSGFSHESFGQATNTAETGD